MKKWLKILKLGNVYVGALKLIDLVSKPAEYVVHRTGDIILVIIRGRYMLKIRELQSVLDEITHRIKLRNIIQLGENQSSQDGISTATKSLQHVGMGDSQTAEDGMSYTTATLVTRSAFDEATTPIDGVSFSTASLSTTEFGESVEQYDSISTDTKQAVTWQYGETASLAFDGVQVSTVTRIALWFNERQWSDDIPQAYVPTDEETLIIRAFPESTYAYDRVLVSTAPAATPFDVSVWYAEYHVTMSVNISEQQNAYDELMLNVASVQAVALQETQDSSDALEYYTTTTGTSAFEISEWYAEYKEIIALNYSEEQNSSDALVLHELVTTHPDTFEISEWYAEYSVA